MAMTHKFNVLLTDESLLALDALARQRGVSKGNIIRRAVDTLLRMEQSQEPCCATGEHCFVRHLHPMIQGRQIGAAAPHAAPTEQGEPAHEQV